MVSSLGVMQVVYLVGESDFVEKIVGDVAGCLVLFLKRILVS
jgi:hypothetical protein